MLLQELYSNEAICLDTGLRQVFLLPQQLVVPQNTVMRQRKGLAAGASGKWVVVLVAHGVALCGHTGVSQNDADAGRHAQPQPVRGQRTLENPQPPAEVVGDAGRIRAAHLSLASQSVENTFFVMRREPVLMVDQSEYTAHQQPSSFSVLVFTGSLT